MRKSWWEYGGGGGERESATCSLNCSVWRLFITLVLPAEESWLLVAPRLWTDANGREGKREQEVKRP